MLFLPGVKGTEHLRGMRLSTGGIFTHKDTNVVFEYFSGVPDIFKCIEGTTHTVCVDDYNFPIRAAIIKKTVAYVAVDEDEYGNTVWEKWLIKKHSFYEDNINHERATIVTFVLWLYTYYPQLHEYFNFYKISSNNVIVEKMKTDINFKPYVNQTHTIWKNLSEFIRKNEKIHAFWML